MYIKVINELCNGCEQCVPVCPVSAIEMVDGLAVIGPACNLCGACVDVCATEAIVIEKPEIISRHDPDDFKGVWIFAEQRNGRTHGVSFELLAKGRLLAEDLNTDLSAVIFGHDLDDNAAELAARGADTVYVVDHPGLKSFNHEIYAGLLTEIAGELRPEVMLCGATAMGRSFFPKVASMLGTGLTADCTELEVDVKEHLLLQTRPAYGGNIMATIVCPKHRPQMATVRPRVFKKAEASSGGRGEIVRREFSPEILEVPTRVIEAVEEVSETINLEDADIIISGGRGLGSRENFKIIEDLALSLGAGVGASRGAVDAGWMPYSHQVGQTGKTVAPKLYIACGISGAIQHMVGMQPSDFIVAINKDPEAPIFKIADIGLVGDIFKILPAMIKQLGARGKNG
jgi:electron transfer flavoprotein alpha subunit